MNKLTFTEIKKIINGIDPMGLLKMGAPDDEYSSEINDILLRKNECNSKLYFEEIKLIFDYWFYPSKIDEKIIYKIYEEIQLLIQN